MIDTITSREKLVEFFVLNKIYPIYTKKGKVSFRKPKNLNLSNENLNEIINQLNLKTKDDIENIRNEVKSKLAELRTNQPIKKWIEDERPREMLIKEGASKLSLSKLFAIILRTGNEGMSAEELARQVLNKFKTLRELDSADISEICKIKGIGIAKASQIKAALEIGKRLSQEKAETMKKIKNPEDAIAFVSDYYAPYLRDAKKEFFNVILLDTRNKIIESIEISKGSLTASIVDPKEIIKEATTKSASSIILVHNHPSGEAEPSNDDIETTNRIVSACELVGVKVLDHIIIGKNQDDYVSLAERGLIKK